MSWIENYSIMEKIVIFIPILLMQGPYFVKASMGKANASQPDSLPSKDHMSEEERLYYLPTQTAFAQTDLVGGGLSTTSPPRLTINPAPPIEVSLSQSATVLPQKGGVAYELSQCVSETPFMEVESRFLMPSKREMSGHLEIPSKTEGGGMPHSAVLTTTAEEN